MVYALLIESLADLNKGVRPTRDALLASTNSSGQASNAVRLYRVFGPGPIADGIGNRRFMMAFRQTGSGKVELYAKVGTETHALLYNFDIDGHSLKREHVRFLDTQVSPVLV